MPAVNNSAGLLYLSYIPDLSTLVAGTIPEFLTRTLIGQQEEADKQRLVGKDTRRTMSFLPGCLHQVI